MGTIYLICLIVGGFFVGLSLLGGTDADVDADFDADVDADFSIDSDVDADAPLYHAESGPGLVDLVSVRTLFLFAAFFGLTGVMLSLIGTGEPWTGVYSALVGLIVGLGGNYVIKRVGHAHVSSTVSSEDISGTTAKVLIPFEGDRRGKISLVARGHRLQLVARAFEQMGAFLPGDEVVIVRMHGAVAEVVKPD